jgi:hypothetical protein
MQQWIEKWDGKLSNVSSGEMPLMLNIKIEKDKNAYT